MSDNKSQNGQNGQYDEYYKIRHSAAHVMAQAVLERFPDAKIAIGPPIKDGFYYDFDLGRNEDGSLRTFTPEDLEAIEKRMRQIVAGKHPFVKRVVSAEEARKLFADQPYKLELIDGLAAGGQDEYGEKVEGPVEISTYRHDTFEDLCRGPHVEHTGQIPPDAFKLLHVAGAYWRGDENRPMLQRIYGTAWKNKKELKAYLQRLEEARARDHRKLGRELDLFSTNHEMVGGGLILWHPKGALMRHLAEEHSKKMHLEGGYDFVYTPHIGRSVLWETSGHLEFYKDSMYAPIEIEGQEYYLKPMNCPFHVHIYKSRVRSYRDLPMRLAEWGTVYRFERSGTLHGMTRVRGFTQDDAHLFCAPEQMPAEIDKVLAFSLNLLRDFGFEKFKMYLSTRPEKRVGEEAMWDASEQALLEALKRSGLPYDINEGDGAFYGPKIDIYVEDALERPWQLSTIQFDFNLPERFDLTYIGADGLQHRPYMIHRALMGSIERFFGVLIEHFAGNFPVWLTPVQVMVIPITDEQNAYAYEVAARLKAEGLRVEVDDGDDRMNAKIRNAQLQKIPYMLVIGAREVEAGHVNVRLRNGQRLGAMPVDEFLKQAQEAIAQRIAI
ncbi:MAG: threonine--tRNA ligase [Caldilineae bacterium]|nr:MAG: threonine--tRNA ligase [Caldilineae bacterium]